MCGSHKKAASSGNMLEDYELLMADYKKWRLNMISVFGNDPSINFEAYLKYLKLHPTAGSGAAVPAPAPK